MIVIKSPDALAGWHLACAEPRFGALACSLSKREGNRATMINVFVAIDTLRVAIEQRIIDKPSGYTLPRIK